MDDLLSDGPASPDAAGSLPVGAVWRIQTRSNWKESNMAGEISIKGQKAGKGERMTRGKGWRLAATKGRKRVFVGTLLQTINLGDKRLAIFSVPK
jgi:hypothetical protein